MYSMRLELGREEDELRFVQYQEYLESFERDAQKKRKKQMWYAKRLTVLGMLLLFFVASITTLFADVSKYHELKDLEEEIARRPVMSAPTPLLDTTIRDKIEEEQRIEEERQQAAYSAVEADVIKSIGEDVVSEYAIVVDINSNTILASRNARTKISPASMTKILTVLVAAENIDESELDNEFTITPEITYYCYKNDCSAVGFSDDEVVTVRDLFYGTILPSGADAAVGLAEYVAGSQEAFVELMNKKLETLGLSDTAHFTNCIGLYNEDHYCSVYDMAMILHAAIDNEFVKEVLSAHIYTTSKTEQHPNGIEISNWFLRRIEDKPVGGEVLCAKTGYVSDIGNCSASYGTDNDGNDFIVVTAKSTSSWRCIYDHVAIYRRFFPKYDGSGNSAAEKSELEEEDAAGEN